MVTMTALHSNSQLGARSNALHSEVHVSITRHEHPLECLLPAQRRNVDSECVGGWIMVAGNPISSTCRIFRVICCCQVYWRLPYLSAFHLQTHNRSRPLSQCSAGADVISPRHFQLSIWSSIKPLRHGGSSLAVRIARPDVPVWTHLVRGAPGRVSEIGRVVVVLRVPGIAMGHCNTLMPCVRDGVSVSEWESARHYITSASE